MRAVVQHEGRFIRGTLPSAPITRIDVQNHAHAVSIAIRRGLLAPTAMAQRA